MALGRRAIQNNRRLSLPVSYKTLQDDKLFDARNVFDNKGVTETRHGIQRFNSTGLSGVPLSISFFKKTDGTMYRIVKVGTIIYTVNSSGAHTSIKTGLTLTTKHRGVTIGNRHFISIESDGLFFFDGTNFSSIGQNAPATLTATIAVGGSLQTTDSYQAYISYYASSIGYETNYQSSGTVTASAPNLQIDLTNIPATATHPLIDKIRVYLKNVTEASERLFIAEISLGATTYTISAESVSSITASDKNSPPLSGGGKYLTAFGKTLAYTGNSTFTKDVFISQDYVPDAFDQTTTSKTFKISGQGAITGIATGLYDNSHLRPFLAIFTKNSTSIYSEIDGLSALVQIDDHIGCVSNETIKVRNGVIYFLSESGWYPIVNGAIPKQNGVAVSLGNGDIDDVFSREGWTYQLNAGEYDNFFSCFYSTLGHYITFIAEGGNDQFYKAYVFEERINGFRPYEFKRFFTCATEGEDASGNQCVILADNEGFLFEHSVKCPRHDDDESATAETIPTFAYLPFLTPDDHATTYNFRELIVRALNSADSVMVKAFPSLTVFGSNLNSLDFEFANSQSGFQLDVSQLDIDVLGDDRTPVTLMADINRVGEAIIIGFFQDIENANIGLISAQINYNKNGNRNL